MADLVIKATDSATGAPYTITVEKTGPDTANLHVSEGGAKPTDNVYQLHSIREVGPDEMQGETSAMFQTPEITVGVTGTGFTISVTHMWFAPAPVTYLATPATIASVRAWLADAKFPPA